MNQIIDQEAKVPKVNEESEVDDQDRNKEPKDPNQLDQKLKQKLEIPQETNQDQIDKNL